jgi:hypothetical protein
MVNVGNRKGASAEELLRGYFLAAGYFVVRGLPVRFMEYDVTDVDLWLYIRPSAATRLRAAVDIKRKSKPKALERIVWAIGLQEILELDQVFVATTDNRDEIMLFAKKNGVRLLNGSFQKKIATKVFGERLSEEELLTYFPVNKKDKMYEHWRERVRHARTRLLEHLDYDGCNAWLNDISYFLEQYQVSHNVEPAVRVLYLMLAYFMIGLDYSMLEVAFDDESKRRLTLADGFRYGAAGVERTASLAEATTKLIEAYSPDDKSLVERIREGILAELNSHPAEVLAAYFCKNSVSSRIFHNALAFEGLAYSRTILYPRELDHELQSVIGVLLDFFGIDRERFFLHGEGEINTDGGTSGAPVQRKLKMKDK